MEWSDQQQAIFDWFRGGSGNLTVRARAGAGKTSTIIEAIQHAPEREILLAAFNKRIADELSTRLRRGEAKTLHSVGFTFVRRNWANTRVDADRGFKIAQEVLGEDARLSDCRLVSQIAAKGKAIAPEGGVKALVELAIQFDLLPEGLEQEDDVRANETLKEFCAMADEAMRRAAAPNREGPSSLDFDDMLFIPVRNGWVRGFYDLVCIDEAQDMSPVQITLALGVVKKGGRIAVVGDDRQAIYGFRGADSGSLDRLKKELSADELGLTITYRCPKAVVKVAQEFVPDFEAAPSAPEGLLRDIVDTQIVAEAQPGDFVLSRKNAPLVRHCLAMLRAGKRARIEGRDIAKGIIALIKKLHARDLQTLVVRLGEWESREVARAIAALGDEGATSKVGQIMDTKETILALCDGLKTVNELEGVVQDLFADTGAGQVIFSSVHKAKGLEAERVFLLEDTFMHDSGRREEQNIRYVAVTRSKNELVFVTPAEGGAA